MELRMTGYLQEGHGYQSRGSDSSAGPGSQEAQILQPSLSLRIRDGEQMTYDISVSIDVVSAASPDALDAMTSASRVNEAATVFVDTTWHAEHHDTSFIFGVHAEEPWRSGTLGGGYLRRLADDNATLGASGTVTLDYFDRIDQTGDTDGQTTRVTANANLEASQLLSPTTIVWGSYGLTLQQGTLENTWNAVPTTAGNAPAGEKLPGTRHRHALATRLAQHLPSTHTTFKLGYRFYVDSFGIQSHTGDVRVYQYLTRWMYVRGSYRRHLQDGADFFVTAMPMGADPLAPRTADSDLDAFDADHWGVSVVVLGARAPGVWLRGGSLQLSYSRYHRSNDLDLDMLSVGYAREL
jgi:hypothetical protein